MLSSLSAACIYIRRTRMIMTHSRSFWIIIQSVCQMTVFFLLASFCWIETAGKKELASRDPVYVLCMYCQLSVVVACCHVFIGCHVDYSHASFLVLAWNCCCCLCFSSNRTCRDRPFIIQSSTARHGTARHTSHSQPVTDSIVFQSSR